MKPYVAFLMLLFLTLSALAQGENGAINETGLSGFPTYHPLVVHFPLILLLVAAIMQLVVLFRPVKMYNYTVAALTILGFLTGLLAATVFHPDPSPNISQTAKQMFENHETFAFITLWISGAASLFKIAGLIWPKKWIEGVAFLLLLGSAVTVSIAGHHGSELVYKQGIGPKGEKLEKEHEH